jgi:hypothetical protein
MPKRSSKDINETAFSIVQHVTEDKRESVKNPAAVALGKLGGLKGGNARAKSLSAKRRSEIAKKAAKSRWGKK